MALPDNFSPFEHLQDMIRLGHNKIVREYFSDLGNESWEPDITTTRGNLRVAATMSDSDTATMMLLRLYLFYDVIGFGRRNLATFYGSRLDATTPVSGHPQLFLVFSQDEAATPPEESPIQHEKSLRLMKYSSASGNAKPAITTANMTEIAKEVKTLFISGGRGITYVSGNKSASYTDPENGFSRGNYMLVNARSEATEVYQKLCNAIDVTFDQDKLVVNDPDKNSTTTVTAGKVTILGKQRQKRRYRPIAILRFRYAYISLGALVPPVFLVDTTLRNKGLVNFP